MSKWTAKRQEKINLGLELQCGPISSLLAKFHKTKAHDIVQANGVAVIRDAFSTTNLAELFHNLIAYRTEALKVIYGGEPKLSEKALFNKLTMAAMLYALDPVTTHCKEENILGTSLFKEMTKGRGWSAVTSIISVNAKLEGARVRVVDHNGGTPKDRRGALFFHQEKQALKEQNFPLGHNIWMNLNPDGQVANVTTPGIQFALGEVDFWRQDHLEDYESSVRPRISRLNILAGRRNDRRGELVQAGSHLFYRPHLRVGDIVVFDHHIPHGSFVPSSAVSARVSCELRAFPKAESC